MAYKGQLTGKLKVSVVSTGKYVMPYFLSEFMNQHDGIELLMDVTNKNKVVESLENNEEDFALVSILPAKLNIQKIDLLQNKLFLVGNTQFDLKKKIYTKDIFKDLPLIFREKGSGTRQTMEGFFEKKQHESFKKNGINF